MAATIGRRRFLPKPELLASFLAVARSSLATYKQWEKLSPAQALTSLLAILIYAAPFLTRRLAPRLYHRWRWPLITLARLAVVMCPATASLYEELARVEEPHLKVTTLLALITLSRLAMLLIAILSFRTDLPTHLVVQSLAVILEQRRHSKTCSLPLYQHEEAKRLVRKLQVVVVALAALDFQPIKAWHVKDHYLACCSTLGLLHWYLGLLLPTYILVSTQALAPEGHMGGTRLRRWLHQTPVLVRLWGLKFLIQVVWAAVIRSVVGKPDVDPGGGVLPASAAH